jgi:hypothetical protein
MNTHDTSSIKGVLAAGTVAPDFALHVTPDQTLSLSDVGGHDPRQDGLHSTASV